MCTNCLTETKKRSLAASIIITVVVAPAILITTVIGVIICLAHYSKQRQMKPVVPIECEENAKGEHSPPTELHFASDMSHEEGAEGQHQCLSELHLVISCDDNTEDTTGFDTRSHTPQRLSSEFDIGSFSSWNISVGRGSNWTI